MVAATASLLALDVGACAGVALAQRASANDTARFLAGLKPSEASPLAGLTRRQSWNRHARSFGRSWKDIERRQLSRIRTWAKTHLKKPSPTLLYMFSGPDYLYANAFFPSAKTYVLTGLEPVGLVPAISPAVQRRLGSELSGLRTSMGSVLSYSFFITKKMKTQLRYRLLSGTLPPLYVFMARAGSTIRSVRLVALDRGGKVQDRGRKAGEANGAPGVEIVFERGAEDVRKLYYFQTDISNGGLKNTGLTKFIAGLGRADGLVKSASYLLHSGWFSDIRQVLLDQVETLVQDDSGIPVRHFRANDWKLEPYGRYLGPISIFPGRYQTQLARIFRRSAQPIDFGIGYRWRPNQSNLLVARRLAASMQRAKTN